MSIRIIRTRKDCPDCGKDLKEFPCYACWKDFGCDAIQCSCSFREEEEGKNSHCYLHGPIYTLLCFMQPEKDKMAQMGIKEIDEGKWVLPDGQEMLPKSAALRVLRRFHENTHWGAQALVDQFATRYMCIGIYNVAKRVVNDCLVCRRVNT